MTYLLCTHEQQMLYRMRHARQIVRIAEATDIDVHGGRSLVGIRVMDEKCFELIAELHYSIGSVVEERLLQAICQSLDAIGLGLAVKW